MGYLVCSDLVNRQGVNMDEYGKNTAVYWLRTHLYPSVHIRKYPYITIVPPCMAAQMQKKGSCNEFFATALSTGNYYF